jgi:divalent metal cation (Fe/Co/Zn/Cd) transporter
LDGKNSKMKEKIAILSILANALLAGGKIAVGIFSNSAAILAAGIDSFADIFSSSISYIGIKISGKPADKEHPYGHYNYANHFSNWHRDYL